MLAGILTPTKRPQPWIDISRTVSRSSYPVMAPSSHTAVLARSLYRSILRELPARPISSPSPLKLRLRTTFSDLPTNSRPLQQQLEEGEQFVQYAKAQRIYATLLERYNPGMSMDEEEKVRMTMRRVGMDAPKSFEWKPSQD